MTLFRRMILVVVGTSLLGAFVQFSEAHEAPFVAQEEIEARLLREFLSFRYLSRRVPSAGRGDPSRTVEERHQRIRQFLGLRFANRWQESVIRYLHLTGTIFDSASSDEGSFFRIFPSEQGSWLNQTARELEKEGVELIIRPRIARRLQLGSYHGYSRRMELVLPPFSGTPMEIVAHEGVHAVIISARTEGVPHLYMGALSSRHSLLKDSYSILDLSEVGGYIETLQTNLGARFHPHVDPSALLFLIRRDLNFLATITSEIDEYFQMGRILWRNQIFLSQARDDDSLSLYYLPFSQKVVYLSNFATREELVPKGAVNLATLSSEKDLSLADLTWSQSRFLTKRLAKLADFYHQINRRVLRLQKNFEEKPNLENLHRQVLAVKAQLDDLNIRWLQEMKVPAGHPAWTLDQRVTFLSRLHLDCQAGLTSRSRSEAIVHTKTENP